LGESVERLEKGATMGRIVRIWRLATGTGHVAAAGILGLLVSVSLFVYANELEPHAGGQPEILASTSRFYPAGWQILAIDPITGEFRNVSNLLAADS
jgi:hypothetical protein